MERTITFIVWSFYIYENGTPQQLNKPQAYRVNDSEKC